MKVIVSMVVDKSTLLVTMGFRRLARLAVTIISGQQNQLVSVFPTSLVVWKEQFRGKINIIIHWTSYKLNVQFFEFD